ncbi:MAG: 5'/3'-nucleotidase SurE [Planctomycetota bacterium]|nr:5'/3'-nucleotidase SurE [Planctomycetota bacterium]MDA1106544.1 5'/3'-nucleotidase SurE [Planctomycetota bacterium]
MRILLTNDDGIHAPGIATLHRAIRGLGSIDVVAPKDVQSATGHGITFHRPLMAYPTVTGDFEGVAIDGRPADCVKVALRSIWPERHGAGSSPDVVISGMNAGANAGVNVIYSGTVAAAVEAAFLGVPAIAVSLYLGGRAPCWERAGEIARVALEAVLRHPLDAHRVVNVNLPIIETADAPMPPIRVVRMNTAAGADGYERRVSPEGRHYYWPAGSGMAFAHIAGGSDVEALDERCITITPLRYDLTDEATLSAWQTRFP